MEFFGIIQPLHPCIPSLYTSRFVGLIFLLSFLEYQHNTYHGPSSKHCRVPLPQSLDAKPLRFTDSPQHRLSRSRRKTRPPPRRKSSSAAPDADDKSSVSIPVDAHVPQRRKQHDFSVGSSLKTIFFFFLEGGEGFYSLLFLFIFQVQLFIMDVKVNLETFVYGFEFISVYKFLTMPSGFCRETR